jgi:hypothetical protein
MVEGTVVTTIIAMATLVVEEEEMATATMAITVLSVVEPGDEDTPAMHK